jgi:hypothetical protein
MLIIVASPVAIRISRQRRVYSNFASCPTDFRLLFYSALLSKSFFIHVKLKAIFIRGKGNCVLEKEIFSRSDIAKREIGTLS